jgi:hypothetical protein
MGLSVMLGQRYAIWDPSVSLKRIVEAAMDLVAHGLEKRPGE